MAWQIEFTHKAEKELEKLDNQAIIQILSFLNNRLANINNPRSIGGPLHGPYEGFWKYRVGIYRLISKINNNDIKILILRVGHRDKVYK
jgi:mRNA interferase RelE/StbE